MFKHLLVPTDGTELSTNTVRRAIAFAAETGAKITFYFAKPEYRAPVGDAAAFTYSSPEDHTRWADAQAKTVLDPAAHAARDAGVSATTLSTYSNVPYKAIIEAAAAAGCDLIFMASHGRRGISGLLLGSETHKVLTHSKIPVLVYR
jgi:nucleotide-binding universal stress UspA family protein